VGDQGIGGEGELDIAVEIIVEIFAADAAISLIDPLYDEREIGQALEDDFFANAEKMVHNRKVVKVIGKVNKCKLLFFISVCTIY
jgi:hypothetical protein